MKLVPDITTRIQLCRVSNGFAKCFFLALNKEADCRMLKEILGKNTQQKGLAECFFDTQQRSLFVVCFFTLSKGLPW
jgi:hypothetical protein